MREGSKRRVHGSANGQVGLWRIGLKHGSASLKLDCLVKAKGETQHWGHTQGARLVGGNDSEGMGVGVGVGLG